MTATAHHPLFGFDLDYGDAPPSPAAVRDGRRFRPATDGTVTMYPRQDGRVVQVIQDCFADAEVAAHLANCAPGKPRRQLAAIFTRLRDRDLRALAAATPEQLAIGWGDCWRYDNPQSGLTCWGYVQPLLELMDAELASCAAKGIPRDRAEREVQAVVDAIKENYGRGWRSGPGYSVVEPAGEHGYSHVCCLAPASRADFDAARARGWAP